MFSPDQKTGLIGERWAYEKLKRLGWPVKLMPDFGNHAYDMQIGKLPIEVKYAQTTYRKKERQGLTVHVPRWQWFIHPTYSKLDDRDWVLILIAEDQKRLKHPFILPGNLLDGRNHLQITSHPTKYSGWLSDWRNEWDVIEFLTQQTYLDDGPTYHQWKAGHRIMA